MVARVGFIDDREDTDRNDMSMEEGLLGMGGGVDLTTDALNGEVRLPVRTRPRHEPFRPANTPPASLLGVVADPFMTRVDRHRR